MKRCHAYSRRLTSEIEINENPVYFLQRKRSPLLLLQNKENELHNDVVRVT